MIAATVLSNCTLALVNFVYGLCSRLAEVFCAYLTLFFRMWFSYINRKSDGD